jgi:Mn-dependent DtxR family transcriptional regulator
MNNMPLHESGEDYLETILILHERTGFVRSIDIASELGYSKPSISRAMGILKEHGFITVKQDGQIVLTEDGEKRAKSVYSKHLLLTRFLNEVLGVSHENSDLDACKIEHVISEETVEKLRHFVERYLSSQE